MSKTDENGIRQFVVAPDDDGTRLDRWFKRHLPDASFNIVSRWARTGQLRVDGKRGRHCGFRLRIFLRLPARGLCVSAVT
jgi:hypothetical protein